MSSALIIPFPVHLTRKPLNLLILSLLDIARKDVERHLWAQLPEGDKDRMSFDNLEQTLPKDIASRTGLAQSFAYHEFALLGMFAISTQQWMRPELFDSFAQIQVRIERMRLAAENTQARRA